MKPSGRHDHSEEPESIEFVPKRELDRAQQEIERLRKQSERLRKENDRLQQETERLRRELEAALRASKRQAAPHSRGEPRRNPKRPGRTPGKGYGRQACRPTPSWVDEQIAVPLPERCPHAAAAWSRKGAKHSIRKKSSSGPSCAVSISPWAAAANAGGGCRNAIGCRPRMRWESAACSWGRRR